ncbi:hypothetical protein ACEE96_04640 [Staphylococcus simulans]
MLKRLVTVSMSAAILLAACGNDSSNKSVDLNKEGEKTVVEKAKKKDKLIH